MEPGIPTGSAGEGGLFVPRDYFDSLRERADAALTRAGGPIDRLFVIGGFSIRFRLAGPALVPRLTPALSHLAADSTERVDLDVILWDSESTGIPMLPPPWKEEELRVNGEIPSFLNAGYYAHYNVYHNALTIFDADGRNAVYWIRNAASVPDHETCSPLFSLFHAWLSRRGLFHVHAGAVGFPDGGALLVGNSGSGKSNTGLVCLDSPLSYAGDDRCLVTPFPVPYIHSIYSTAKTNPEDVDKLPFLSSRSLELSYLENGKLLYFLDQLFPGKLISGFPLKVIIMPRVTGRPDTDWVRASPAAGLLMLAPHTSIRWPSAGRETLKSLSEIFRSVPCYQLNVGTEREQIPEAITELIRRA